MSANQSLNNGLEINYWYVTHKLLLRRILLILLLVLCLVLLVGIIFSAVFNFVVTQRNYQAQLTQLAGINPDYQQLRSGLPQEIKVNTILKYPNRDNFDLVAVVSNDNPNWWANFDYQFQLGETLSPGRKGFILPGETKKIMALSVPNGDMASRLVFKNIQWYKEINYSTIKEEKNKFDLQNIEFVGAKDTGISGQVQVSRVNFSLTNNTAYGYKNINFYIELKAGAETAAITQITSGVLPSLETKKFTATFFQPLPRITSTEIIPEVNFLDSAVFIK